jgi:hypothetical protein
MALLGVSRSAGVPSSDLEATFVERCRQRPPPRVIELGTLRSIPERSTMHRELVPHAREFLGTDLEPGPDVDIVADLHRLSDVVGEERFDVVLSFSTFEHLKYPHLVAHEVLKTLAVGGLLFIQTHQSFPLHAYPLDYFRFSREALAGLFGTNMGFKVEATGYDFPAKLYSRRLADSERHLCFLNTMLWGEKLAATPREYHFEL